MQLTLSVAEGKGRQDRLFAFDGVFSAEPMILVHQNIMKLLLSITVVLIFACEGVSQECSVDSGFRGNRYSIDRYTNRNIIVALSNIDDIAPIVRNRLQTHLRTKLGEGFLGRLKFGGGEYIDIEKLKIQSPRDYARYVPMGHYDLMFWFSDSRKGLKRFYTTMVLDKDGDVMEDINLPEIARQPDKAQIISCRKAVAIARERGFNTEGVRVSFDYSSARKAFVWIVTKPRPDIVPLIGKGSYEKLEIDANTGAVFNTQIETIII